jgi:hypothetical protein
MKIDSKAFQNPGHQDILMTVTFYPAHKDLSLGAYFVNPDIGDRVKFTYNGSICEGEITERMYDGQNPFNYKARVFYCNNWNALGDSTEVQVSLTDLTPLLPNAW